MIKNEFYLTKPFIKETSQDFRDELIAKLKVVCPLFPELTSNRLEVGLTTWAGACAHILLKDRIKIGYNPHCPVSYYILGHELTHFVQCISDIPHGEEQCDIWTLARNKLFLDEPPRYLAIPRKIRTEWDDYSNDVREICISAIEVRKGTRQYIKWMERKIKELV